MNRALYILPVLVLGVILVFAVRGLAIDPSVQPSALLNEPVPGLSLEPVPGRGEALSDDDLRGRPHLLNVYGSWCAPCAVEHPFLMQLASEGVAIYGLDWRDTPEDAAAWLERRGNPYVKVGIEPKSTAILDLGVTGAPETFLIDSNGVIRHRHVGMMTPDAWRRDLAPKLEALKALEPDPDPVMPGGAPGGG
ncbi:DsbE family thiol:disulfide interchange protein [Parvularcula dongshanensis]|uniref:Cytochrome c biogenesis protein CcmG/thiol:disulfide interchange protein DsbE n=1 Tax=Parvularcula dongshanensis TaxID=1173995 RepID=A0A840I5R7_9PROT|nr:DsbE family thiol:disulfide interchange protein [Parvularcula dongshanensis]MBB4659360.1 cytochrome c biogenesis protein CcmG/thiol:disulfide interchange protein DsbE [Parvularcula dongshanensis]